jgi:hypothetical protein
MPRYFFNVYDHDHKPDPDGTRLPGPRAAQIEAIILAGYLLQDHADKVLGCEDWHLTVTDVTGAVVCRLDLSVIGNPAPSEASQAHESTALALI